MRTYLCDSILCRSLSSPQVASATPEDAELGSRFWPFVHFFNPSIFIRLYSSLSQLGLDQLVQQVCSDFLGIAP